MSECKIWRRQWGPPYDHLNDVVRARLLARQARAVICSSRSTLSHRALCNRCSITTAVITINAKLCFDCNIKCSAVVVVGGMGVLTCSLSTQQTREKIFISHTLHLISMWGSLSGNRSRSFGASVTGWKMYLHPLNSYLMIEPQQVNLQADKSGWKLR